MTLYNAVLKRLKNLKTSRSKENNESVNNAGIILLGCPYPLCPNCRTTCAKFEKRQLESGNTALILLSERDPWHINP